MFGQLFPALRIMLFFTALTGLVYPALVTGICTVLFHKQASGSLAIRDGEPIGSELIGQNFSKPEYLHPRPSAAGNDGYDGAASSGSNYGPTNAKLIDRTKTAAANFHKQNPGYPDAIPSDAITASGSGLDPHISPATASAQAERIADARHVSKTQVMQLIQAHTEGRDFGFLGEPRVNVLETNLALDQQLSRLRR